MWWYEKSKKINKKILGELVDKIYELNNENDATQKWFMDWMGVMMLWRFGADTFLDPEHAALYRAFIQRLYNALLERIDKFDKCF